MAIQAQKHSENLRYPLGGSGSPQDLIDNCFGLIDSSYNLQQQQQYLSLQHRNQKLFIQNNDDNNNNNINNNQSMGLLSQSMAAQMGKQNQELDTFISLQNERLRLGLLQLRKQQFQSIIKKCETKAQIMMKQKDEEIAKANKRIMELENFLRRIEMERQTWQRLAIENEEMIVSLNNTIEQIRQQQQQQQQQQSNCFSNNNGVEDSESCCVKGEHDSRKMICKKCNSGNSCMILFPCRHLCLCKDCELFLDSCPVCRTVRDYSIEVLF